MKIGLYDPYLDTLGGGERYLLTAADFWANKGHQVDIFWYDQLVKTGIKQRLGFDLNRVNFVDNIFYSKKTNLFQKLKTSRKYDLIFYLSDGSIPFLMAKKNILHFQVPFQNVRGRSLLNKIKLSRFHTIICNSFFTKKHIDREFGIKSQVIYPPVAIENFKSGKKENLILAVGRFSKSLHAKRQDVLINAFKKIPFPGWRLVLAGGSKKEDQTYLEELKKMAQGLPVQFLVNLDFEKLRQVYAQAKIFWQATGFGINENQQPEKTEHFGITVVEAMAAGAIPVVIGKGGIPEIITQGQNGFLWQTEKELIKQTLYLIKQPEIIRKILPETIKSSKRFSRQVFCQRIDELIKA